MLNLDIKKDFSFPAPISTDYHIVNVQRDEKRKPKVTVIMTYITEEEENIIDNLGSRVFKFTRGDRVFSITHNNIFSYGVIDLTSDTDVNIIKSLNFLNYLGSSGVYVSSRYDYDTHTFKSPINRRLYTETWNPLYLCKIAHGALGKPKRILLFKIDGK